MNINNLIVHCKIAYNINQSYSIRTEECYVNSDVLKSIIRISFSIRINTGKYPVVENIDSNYLDWYQKEFYVYE